MAPRRALACVALVLSALLPAVLPQAISVSTINDRTQVGDVYVSAPKVYLTVACNAGSSFNMYATDTNTTTGKVSSKIVTVSCFGSTHSWALRPVAKVPARTAVFRVIADIKSDLLTEASKNATVRIIKQQQARGAGIVYLPDASSGNTPMAYGGNCTFPNGTWCNSVARDQVTREIRRLRDEGRRVARTKDFVSSVPDYLLTDNVLDCNKVAIAVNNEYGLSGVIDNLIDYGDANAGGAAIGALCNLVKAGQTDQTTLNYQNQLFANCSIESTGTGINGVRACDQQQIQVTLGILDSVKALQNAVQAIEDQVNNMQLLIMNMVSTQLQQTDALNLQAQQVRTVAKQMQETAATVQGLATITASVAGSVYASAATSAANEETLNTNINRLGAALVDTNILQTNGLQQLGTNLLARIEVSQQTLAQQLLRSISDVTAYVQNVEFNAALTNAQSVSRLTANIDEIRKTVQSLQAMASQQSTVLATSLQTIQSLAQLELYHGTLERDYHTALKLMDSMGLVGYLGTRGTPPTDLSTGHLMLGMRTALIGTVSLVTPGAGGTVTVQACPQPMTTAPLKATMDSVYMNVTLPGVQVAYDIDRTFLRYNESVVMAVTDTSTPDENTTWLYVSYSYCAAHSVYCGTCGYSLALCLSPNLEDAAKFVLNYNPLSPNTSTVTVRSQQTFVLLPALSSLSAYRARITGTDMCLSPSQTPANASSLFTANLVDGSLLTTRLLRWDDTLALSMYNATPSGSYVTFASDTCLTFGTSPSYRTFVRFLPSFAWGDVNPLGRSNVAARLATPVLTTRDLFATAGRTGIDSAHGLGALQARIAEVTAPYVDSRHFKRSADVRSTPNKCPVVYDYTNSASQTGPSATNTTACVSTPGCIMVYPATQSWALIGHMTGWDGLYTLNGTASFRFPELGAYDVTALAEVGSSVQQQVPPIQTILQNATMAGLSAGTYMTAVNTSAPATAFRFNIQSNSANNLVNMGSSPTVYIAKLAPVYMMVGVPKNQRVVFTVSGGNLLTTAPWSTPMTFTTWATPSTGNGPVGDNMQNGITPAITTSGVTANYYDWQTSSWFSSGQTTATFTFKADPTKDITYYRWQLVGPLGRYCCLSDAASPCNNAIKTTKSANPTVTPTQFFGYRYPGPVVDINENLRIYCKLNPSYNDVSYTYSRTNSDPGILSLPNSTYSRSQVFQVPGSVQITIQPDPDVTPVTYSGECVQNPIVAGTGGKTYYQQYCGVGAAFANIEFCTGRSCGQNYTEYYDVVSYDASITGKGINPARGYAVATWFNKNYEVIIQGDPTCNATGGCNTTFTDTGSVAGATTGYGLAGTWGGSIKGTIKVGFKRTTANIFAGMQATATKPTDSNLGVVPFTQAYATCAAACHDLPDQYTCLNNPGNLCTWRYFRQYQRNYCMNYAFDLNTSCQLLNVAACTLPQYAPFCALNGNGTACVRGTTITNYNSTVPAQRYLGECRYVSWRPDPLGMNTIALNGCSYFNSFDVYAAWENYNYDQGLPSDIRYYRTCAWNLATCQGEDLNSATWNMVLNFVPCYLRYEQRSPTEYNCLWNSYPAVPLTGAGPASSILPYCTYIQTSASTPGECTLSSGVRPSDSVTFNVATPSACFGLGAYCNTEATPLYPNNVGGTPQYNLYKLWGYLYGGACTTNATFARPCSAYNTDLAGCIVKNLCTNKSPVQQCEVYVGQCTQPCAVFNGDVTGCINNVNGKCYYMTNSSVCTQVTTNFQSSSGCSKGNCVYINTPCNQFYTNTTGCQLDSRCTWIHYDPSTSLTSYCQLSSDVAFGSCVNGTAGVPMRYCDIGNGDPLNSTISSLMNACAPLYVGQHISVADCMSRNGPLGNPCIYMYSGGGVKGACTGPTDPTCAYSSCYARDDPNMLTISQQFSSLNPHFITRPQYLAQFDTGFSVYQGVTLGWLQENILVPSYDLDVASLAVYGPLLGTNNGLVLVPDDIKAFYPCPTDSLGNAMVNSGGFCCSLSEYNSYLDTCNGPSRIVNDLHPDNVFKVAFAEYCAANSNMSGSTVIAVFNRTVNVYYLAHIDPDPNNPKYALDISNCPILLLDTNSTSTVSVGNATVYPYIELDAAISMGIYERLQWLYPLCIVDYSLDEFSLRLVRISQSTLDSLSSYYSYFLYNSTSYATTEFGDVYGNMNGGSIDLRPLNISGLTIPGLQRQLVNDMRARTGVVLTQYGTLDNAFVSAGEGTRIVRLGGAETDNGRTIASWEMTFGAYDPHFVDVLMINAHAVHCSMTLNITDIDTGISVVYDQPRTCTMASSYAQMIPSDYTYMVHAPVTVNGVDRIIIAPDAVLDVQSPYEASQGKASCFRTLSSAQTSMDYATFSKLCPLCDYRCFSNSLMSYSKARNPLITDWRADFCGVLSGSFENAEDLDYVLGISMLREQGFLYNADWWVNENLANPDDDIEKIALFTDLQAAFADLGCQRNLSNYCDISSVQYETDGNVTTFDVVDFFRPIWIAYKSLRGSHNYSTIINALAEEFLLPVAQSGTSIQCGNCGGVAQKPCALSGISVPQRSVMGASNQWCALSQILQLYHDDVQQKLLGVAVSTVDDYSATWLVPGNLQFQSITVAGCPGAIDGVQVYTPPSLDTRLATIRMFNPSQTGTLVLLLRVIATNCSSLDIVTLAPLATTSANPQVCYGDYTITLSSQYDGTVCLNATGNLNETLASIAMFGGSASSVVIRNTVTSLVLENLQQLAYDTAAAVYNDVSDQLLQTTALQLSPVYANLTALNSTIYSLQTFLTGSANTPLPNITFPELLNNFDSRLKRQDLSLNNTRGSIIDLYNNLYDLILAAQGVQDQVDTNTARQAEQSAVTQQVQDTLLQQVYKNKLTSTTLINVVTNKLNAIQGQGVTPLERYSNPAIAVVALIFGILALGLSSYNYAYLKKHAFGFFSAIDSEVRSYLSKGQPGRRKAEPFSEPIKTGGPAGPMLPPPQEGVPPPQYVPGPQQYATTLQMTPMQQQQFASAAGYTSAPQPINFGGAPVAPQPVSKTMLPSPAPSATQQPTAAMALALAASMPHVPQPTAAAVFNAPTSTNDPGHRNERGEILNSAARGYATGQQERGQRGGINWGTTASGEQ